ncbi:MAG: DUF4928 family protein [Anaerolineae bacterium]
MTNLEKESQQILENWLKSCTRGKKVSRNTISVGVVVFDHLLQTCPVSRDEVVSPGGEIKGARSSLGNILEKHGIPRRYLKEVTTRQGHQDGQRLSADFNWGRKFTGLPEAQRHELIQNLINRLAIEAHTWLKRQNLKLHIDRRQSPTAWIKLIVENAKSRSGGVVEQHLVGAKLARRFQQSAIPNHPAHAADRQTARAGDFVVSNIVYHVTATPGRNVIEKCADNIKAGYLPILLVPESQVNKAVALAEDEGVDSEMSVISIEAFVTVNIVELATEANTDLFTVLQEIVQIYNQRLAEVETDLSLQIEIR